MILSELVRLDDSGRFGDSAPAGFEWKKIPFILVIDRTGKLREIADTRAGRGQAGRFLVPAGAKRTKGISANLLWDTAEYVLGIARDGELKRAAARHAAFKAKLKKLTQKDEGIKAVGLFLENIPWPELEGSGAWAEILQTTPVLSFRLVSDEQLVCARPAVANSIDRIRWKENRLSGTRGICLVTGREEVLEKVHPWIFGVDGTDQQRGRLISSGQRAFDSYGIQMPVGKAATSSYGAALNHLLSSQSKLKIQLGHLTVVFWAEQKCGFEDLFRQYVGASPYTEPQEAEGWARSLQRYIEGRERKLKFFVLGLAGHGSRISVTLWIAEKIGRIASSLQGQCRFEALRTGARSAAFVSLTEAIGALSQRSGMGTLGDGLSAAWIRASVLGEPFPQAGFRLLLANASARGGVNCATAALMKACVNRGVAAGAIKGEQLPDALDLLMRERGYLWGRFFALCEYCDWASTSKWSPNLGARLYKSVSTRPVAWADQLYRVAISQMSNGDSREGFGELRHTIESVLDALQSTRYSGENLSAEEQGRFAVGYFQQLERLR